MLSVRSVGLFKHKSKASYSYRFHFCKSGPRQDGVFGRSIKQKSDAPSDDLFFSIFCEPVDRLAWQNFDQYMYIDRPI